MSYLRKIQRSITPYRTIKTILRHFFRRVCGILNFAMIICRECVRVGNLGCETARPQITPRIQKKDPAEVGGHSAGKREHLYTQGEAGNLIKYREYNRVNARSCGINITAVGIFSMVKNKKNQNFYVKGVRFAEKAGVWRFLWWNKHLLKVEFDNDDVPVYINKTMKTG